MTLSNPLIIIDTGFAPKNIATGTSVYTYTAPSSGIVLFAVRLNNAVGGGDYVTYLRRQWGGVGTATVLFPKTTNTIGAGETTPEFVTIPIFTKSGDVVDIYVDGLAGDTAVTGSVQIVKQNFSLFEPSADGVLLLSGTSAPTVAQIDTQLSSSHGTGSWATGASAAGSGATTTPITITVLGVPRDGVEVWATTDAGGNNVVASGVTNALGIVTFYLDPGTYYCFKQLAGVNFTNPEILIVV